MAYKLTHRSTFVCFFTVATALPGWAGSWGTPTVLGNNAYSGTISLDAKGNMTAAWNQLLYTSGVLSGAQISASTAGFGQPWSAPVDISGSIGTGASYPAVHTSAAGNVTAIYTNADVSGNFVDHPAGGHWGLPGETNGATNGSNEFFVMNDGGDQGLAWGLGTTRTASTVSAVYRPASGVWSAVTTISGGPHAAFDGSLMAPDGTMAVAWESYNSVCGSRVCKTSNWVLHVTTHAPGAQNWVDSGALLGPDSSQHFGQLAADGLGNLGVICLSGGNLVSLVRHVTSWTAPAVVASTSAIGFYTGTGRDNRVYGSDTTGHATFVSWNPGLTSLVAVDGNLVTNTWGTVTPISGNDQSPGYFAFAMSGTGAAVAFWNISPLVGSTATWRAVTRSGPGAPWSAPATVGTSFEGSGPPEAVAINAAGQAAVVFHGYSSDFLTYIEYTNVYRP